MSDWVKRISSLLNKKSDKDPYPLAFPPQFSTDSLQESLSKSDASSDTTNFFQHESKDDRKVKHYNWLKHDKINIDESLAAKFQQEGSMSDTQGMDASEAGDNDNVKALQKLRSLPRGSEIQVESRIAAIKNLLGEKEIFKTLQILRWPKGIVCPRCHSSKVVRRDPPPDAPDKRHYYVCLTCKGEGDPSDFDDFTGLPVGTLQGLRQWMLCWYLIGFCSMSQIARVLGLSVYEVTQIASLGSQVTEIASAESELKDKVQAKERKSKENRKAFHERAERTSLQDKDYTESASKQPFKPGYKSKK